MCLAEFERPFAVSFVPFPLWMLSVCLIRMALVLTSSTFFKSLGVLGLFKAAGKSWYSGALETDQLITS
jgi:hypothetical protein